MSNDRGRNMMTTASRVSQRTRFGRQAFAVTGPLLWNQLLVTMRATSINTPDCFKRALKAFLLSFVQPQTAKEHFRGRGVVGYSKAYYMNINIIGYRPTGNLFILSVVVPCIGNSRSLASVHSDSELDCSVRLVDERHRPRNENAKTPALCNGP